MKEIFERTSVRQYTQQPVERGKIEALLRAAMCAPSSGNERPWHFIVLERPEDFLPIMEISPHVEMLKQAKCAILVCADTTQKKYRFDFWPQDCSAATENLLIEAKHQGLGAVWCGIYPDEEKIAALRELYRFPDYVEVLAVVPVGYPAYERPVKDRFKAERVHIGSWERVLRPGSSYTAPEFAD
ncbi:nitroreductase family protein [Pseudoflavonifractor phocaeensis]|uniref:nitroreductase family protein n=1 Tax=Pseudoflavonifractor phocaeensis TaxID=1870988 RepID=UPI001F303D2A|nr:nitroreductase family protein [Pseudoflavonifractor phocaeensis]MCF2662081.1 nitroreductase family protein [Pseudoflavonifractor phocaeensis]